MFYSVFVLGKKGPLARVWLAAHWDKKITKAQILETNIVESVDSILTPRVKLSLRTSSHLLLGIVRIYARKTLYLLQDCQDAAFKIKSAFRPGAVDLPDGKTEAAISSITLPEFTDFVTDFDLLPEPPGQIEPTQVNTNLRTINLIQEMASETFDLLDGGGNSEFSSVHIPSTSREDDTYNKDKDPLGFFDRPTMDDGFGGPVGMADVDDMFSLPLTPEVQQQMQAQAEAEAAAAAAAAKEKAKEPEDRPESRLSDRSDSSYGNPASIAPSGPSSPDSPPPVNEDHEMVEAPPIDPDHQMGPPLDKDGEHDLDQESLEIPRAEHVFRKPETQESMVLEPLEGPGFERRRKRRKKLGIIIDEVKVLSGEEMKAQLSDTSDIVSTLDLAPPTKKLMHWKRTGGSEKLFALSEKPIPSKVLIMYYTRHLVTNRIEVEQELPEEMINGDIDEQPEQIKEQHSIQQEENFEQFLPPISPLKEIQPPKTPRTPRRESDTHKSPVKKKRKTADEREKDKAERQERKSKSSVHSDRHSNHINDTDSSILRSRTSNVPFDDQSSYDGNVSVIERPGNLNPLNEIEEEHYDQYEQPLSVGPPEEMMPDETAEQYEERMRNKRTTVLLRLMSKQLEEGAVSFTRLVCHNRRKQVAQKFFSLLVLKKQQAVDLQQDMGLPYGEILITKGYRYDEAIASSSL